MRPEDDERGRNDEEKGDNKTFVGFQAFDKPTNTRYFSFSPFLYCLHFVSILELLGTALSDSFLFHQFRITFILSFFYIAIFSFLSLYFFFFFLINYLSAFYSPTYIFSILHFLLFVITYHFWFPLFLCFLSPLFSFSHSLFFCYDSLSSLVIILSLSSRPLSLSSHHHPLSLSFLVLSFFLSCHHPVFTYHRLVFTCPHPLFVLFLCSCCSSLSSCRHSSSLSLSLVTGLSCLGSLLSLFSLSSCSLSLVIILSFLHTLYSAYFSFLFLFSSLLQLPSLTCNSFVSVSFFNFLQIFIHDM
ncbi:unnamed protein product [Acanthosepion pharaonis]|uniref:Uncharacterized protein n=1 Tax=Acanthosepion pharaonis TaxID=158019 RepID=A0A812C263_ACAPH|nr:unnamed protein product [Sepia pharaonis]